MGRLSELVGAARIDQAVEQVKSARLKAHSAPKAD